MKAMFVAGYQLRPLPQQPSHQNVSELQITVPH